MTPVLPGGLRPRKQMMHASLNFTTQLIKSVFMYNENQGLSNTSPPHPEVTNRIEYQDCFIAFLDILGFKNKVLDSLYSSDMLRILRESLLVCSRLSSGDKKIVEVDGVRRDIEVQSRFFSDSIVVFMKINPEDIPHLFFMIRYLQDKLWGKGLCLRGAVTIGGMFWPPSSEATITLGPGLIDAHNLESKKAIYPRIVVSEPLYDYIVLRDVYAYPFATKVPLRTCIRQDIDGQYFLDLLNRQINRTKSETFAVKNEAFAIEWQPDSDSKYEAVLSDVELLLKRNEDVDEDEIRAKYAWLRRYKNMSCK